MNDVKVQKAELLTKLRANRTNHKATFEEAAQGYRDKVIATLDECIQEARKGKLPRLLFNLPMPIDQTAQYDRVIGMLELSLDDTIDLSEDDYRQYVMDEWGWTATTSATNALYTKSKF